MITFTRWLKNLREHYFGEAQAPNMDNEIVRNLTLLIINAIKNGNYSDELKKVGSEFSRSEEMQPGVIGSKIRRNLRGIDFNDQEDIVQEALVAFSRIIHEELGKYKDKKIIDSQDFGSKMSGYFQKQINWKKFDFLRSRSKRATTLSSLKSKSQRDIEPSYGDDQNIRGGYELSGEDTNGIKITARSWNDSIEVLMDVRNTMMEHIRYKQTVNRPTAGIEVKLPHLNRAIALMRNMPHQITTGVSGNSATTTDTNMYNHLRDMILDPESPMEKDDKADLASWAFEKNFKQKSYPKYLIAAALWINSGMRKVDKPEILNNTDAKDTLDEGSWIYRYAEDPTPLQIERKKDGKN